MFTNVGVSELKQSEMCQQNSGMKKIGNGSYLFDSSSTDNELLDLACYAKSNVLSIVINAQNVESKIKDDTLRKTTNRSELTTTCIHNLRSLLVGEIGEATKADENCVIREKNSNDNDANFLPGNHFNKSMLMCSDTYFLKNCSDEETRRCQRLLALNGSWK